MDIQDRLKQRVAHLIIERPAGKLSLDELIARLEESGRQLGQQVAQAVDTLQNRGKLLHIIGLERWGQSRLRVALGEPLALDEYDGYRPPASLDWPDLQSAFQTTRQETLSLAQQLQEIEAGNARVSHNDFGELSIHGWLYYLNMHATLEGKSIDVRETTVPSSEQVVQIALAPWLNVFLLRGQEGGVLVDAGLPGQAERILEGLAAHGVAPEDIRLILITHAHGDHYGSAAELRQRSGAPIAIHALDAPMLRGEAGPTDIPKPSNRILGLLMRIPSLQAAFQVPAIEPDIVFEDEWRLDEYGVAGRVVPTPGHSPGSVSIVLDSGEAIVGDMVMGGILGLLRRPGPPIIAWDRQRNQESLQQLAQACPGPFYASHGGPFASLSAPPQAGLSRPVWGIALALLVALVLVWQARRK